jgi:hypothetical protein
MKKIRSFLIISAVVFMTSSCFLFRPTHERCPAYGYEQLDLEKSDIEIQILSNEKS